MASPSRLGPYELGPELGRGSNGVVYRAVDVRLRREVALKVLPGALDAFALEDFMREARAAARLRHPGIVVVYGAEVIDGVRAVALELVDGGSLRDRLRRHGPLPSRQAAGLIADLALAVQAAHDQGVVHRDLKPANVLLEKDGRPRLTDFGLARDERAALRSNSGDIIGTPAYMSPEQARGDVRGVGPWTDVWGLGAVLFECLTGQPPYPGKDAPDVLRRIVTQDPPSVASVRARAGLEPLPEDLVTVCGVALERDPARRYSTAAALAEDLRRWLDGRPILARPPSRARRLAGLWRRHRRAALAGVAVAAVTALLVGLVPGWVSRARREREWAALLAGVGTGPGAVLREKAVEELARDPAAAPLLVAALEDAAARLQAVTRELLLTTLDPLTEQERARQAAIAPLREALDRVAALRPEERLPREHVRALDEARRRLARRGEAGRPTRPEALLRAAHRARLGEQALLRAAVAAEALGRLRPGDDATIDALGRWLHAEEDEERVLVAAAALGRQRVARAARAVLRLSERFDRGGATTHRAAHALARELAGALPPMPEPTTALEHLDRSDLRLLLDDEAGGVADLERALALDPGDPLAWRSRANLHIDDEAWEPAVAALDRALALEPDDPEALSSLAFALAHLDGPERLGLARLDHALASCDRAIALDPFDAAGWNARGFVKGRRGDADGALSDLSRAIELDPAFAEPYINRALIRTRQGDHEGAIEDHSQALRLNPDLAEAWNNRGVAKADTGDLAGALADLARAVELKPLDANMWCNLAHTRLLSRDPRGAIADATRAIAARPEHGRAWLLRGKARTQLREWAAARPDLQRGLELAPDDLSGWGAWGFLAMSTGDLQEAIRAFTKQIDLAPRAPAGWAHRGMARLQAGDVQGALADCRRGTELAPRDAQAWRNLAEALAESRDLRGALEAITTALALDAASTEGWCHRAKYHLVLNRLDEALVDAQRAVDADASNPDGYAIRGAVHRARRDVDAALDDFQRVLDLLPGDDPAADGVRRLMAELRAGKP